MELFRKFQNFVGVDQTGYLVMILANTVWTVGLLVSAETEYATVFYIGIVRGIITVLSSYIIARAFGWRLDIRNKSDLRVSLIRAFITGVQQVVTVFAFYYLPPSLVYTITNIGPIIVFVIDYFKNGISVTPRQIAGVAVAAVGLIVAVNSLVIMDWLGYESFVDNSKYHYVQSTLAFKMLVCVILFVEYIFWAYAMIITKDLKETNPIQLSFVSGILYGGMGTLLYFPYQNTRLVTPYELVFDIIFAGGLITLATYLYMVGLTISKKTGNLTMTNFATVIFGYIISIVRYGETPNALGVFGSAFIFIGLFLVLIKKQETNKGQK